MDRGAWGGGHSPQGHKESEMTQPLDGNNKKENSYPSPKSQH